jgi:type II secretory pathway component GspD/PulD (secretin)
MRPTSVAFLNSYIETLTGGGYRSMFNNNNNRNIQIDPIEGGDGSINMTGQSLELPNIEMRSLRSTVMLPDKGTLVLGGYTKALRQRTHSGVPFLSHIPFLGRLFSKNGVYDQNRRLFYLLGIEIFEQQERESQH